MNFADAHFGDTAPCGCCGHHATDLILNQLSVQLLERSTLDYAGLTLALREETNDAPYVPEEVHLTSLLSENAASVADEIEDPIVALLDAPHLDVDRLMSALNAANATWENKAWPSTLEAKVGKGISNAALTGGHEVPFAPLLSDTDRMKIVNGMVSSAKYTTNNYFNTQVMPAVADAAHQAALLGQAGDRGALEAIHRMLDQRLRSVPYWNLVANGAASRAYHFGLLKVGVAAGQTTVEFQAVIDEKTSAVCRHLNGTRWRAADVSLFADRVASAPVDQLKQVAPWLKLSEISGKTPQELLNMGVVIPPVHGRCRSKLAFV